MFNSIFIDWLVTFSLCFSVEHSNASNTFAFLWFCWQVELFCSNSDLASNNLTGTIPDLSSFTNLQLLSLQNNQLTGTIPSFNSSLTTMSVFSIFQCCDLFFSFLQFCAVFLIIVMQRFLVQLAHWIDTFNSKSIQSWHSVSFCGFFVFADSRSYLNDNQLDGTIPNSFNNIYYL